MPYAISFPLIKRPQTEWAKTIRFFNNNVRDWKIIGELTLGSETIRVRIDLQPEAKEFRIDQLTGLKLFYWGWDKVMHLFPSGYGSWRRRRIFDKGNNNFIDFYFKGQFHSYEFYIGKEEQVNRLKKILFHWYGKGFEFKEYYGKLESYLLKHKHIIEREKREKGEN